MLAYATDGRADKYKAKSADGKSVFVRVYAPDTVDPGLLDDKGQLGEVSTTKAFSHPNICRLVSNGTLPDGSAYIATEFASGESLRQRLMDAQRPFSAYETKALAKTILTALDYMHKKGLCHNTISPQNVMLSLSGGTENLMLTGLSRTSKVGNPIKPNLSDETPFFLAPERLLGESSVESDLYSVGAIIYRLLTNRLPWLFDTSGLTEEQIVDMSLAMRHHDLDMSVIEFSQIDAPLVEAMRKALSMKMEERFASAEEFIAAIDGKAIEKSEPTVAKPTRPAQKASGPDKKKGGGFADIAGMEGLKRLMRSEVIDALNSPEVYRSYGISLPNGMLLYGPPGCGKTFFAKKFAEEVGFNFLCITPSELKSRYVNATQENIAKMFKEAAKKAPTIIFIDEINELLPNRDSDVHEMYRSAVNEMLAQMDRTGEKGIFVIGATNYPDQIDPAMLRAGRMEKKYFIGLPDHEARVQLFKLSLVNRPSDFGIDYNKLATLTDGYISADITVIVNDAARLALSMRAKISMAILAETIARTKPSLSRDEIAKYEAMRKKFEGDPPPPGPEKRRIGF